MSDSEHIARSREHELQVAALRGDLARVRRLIAARADVRARGSLALRLACCEGHADIVRLLIQCDPSQLEGYSMALGNAAFFGHAETVAALIHAGAQVRVRHDEALYFATAEGHAQVARVLLDAGACLDDNTVARLNIELIRQCKRVAVQRKRLKAINALLWSNPAAPAPPRRRRRLPVSRRRS